MTINELDQGIRNLIASQPMVTAGVNGDVVNGINSLIDAYRNLMFRVQSYPCQDVLKFGLSNELAKIETSFTNMAFQVLQERGINIMLYIPRTGAQYGPMVNGFGMINTTMDPNVMAGQMMYSSPVNPTMPSPMMQMQNTMNPQGRPMSQPYNQMQPTMPGVAGNNFAQRSIPRTNVPTFGGYSTANRPVKLEPTAQSDQGFKTRSAPQSKIKPAPKAAVSEPIVKNGPAIEPVADSASSAPSPAEMLMGTSSGHDSNAKGRDYLMELLKK